MYKILHPGIIAGRQHIMVYSFEKKSKTGSHEKTLGIDESPN
jgi:hypothetical protein